MALLSFLDREHSIAKPGYNRWRVPPAALAIHLSIGQAYAFSVFKLPMSKLLGISQSAPGDWPLSETQWVFSLAIVFLGLSAAVFGSWLERVGPRRAMFTAALCFSGGFLIAAVGVRLHLFWLVLGGYGVLGGIGLGLGYISPVSTLIKWFPDRPGMATGMAIMGFGGGAFIASPLSVILMKRYETPTSVGVWETFVTMGIIYFVYMMFGVFTVRLPPPGWKPRGFVPPATPQRLVTTSHVSVNEAIRTPQFWLLWVMLCVNVSAGIGILEQASPMIQEIFSGRIGPAAAAGFVALLSLANMIGRFSWASASDYIGRKTTYLIFFSLGAALYITIPIAGNLQSVVLFVLCTVVILSMYGGGFATIPAYLRDLFGTMEVGAIHGRLLTAWSVAGVVGPSLVNTMREHEIALGVPRPHVYDQTMYIVAGLLLVGLICDLMVRPVDEKHHYQGNVTEPVRGPVPAPAAATGGR
ncbi:MAG TPA: OFA family MFS transporter [Gemmatimonadaceae bacterium]|nr:OFA family MFS transporter [Gemmatimonadaceae bacterium]